ncbi:hemerythrin domain-containing protein [Rhodoferax sp.]|uniref:hemerythrin domain-containing protein n=1 Tax=Rhodoferax sp. TaxID=50421 RepID=UPI0025E57004|nr:hemerythrin domain-containing protein [Rhodoferax sp.]MCM2339748.1 hemerythrin domain-containing protein [Rhodoferax sp.]
MIDSKSKAISIIRAEHRVLGAVINNIKTMLLEVQAQRMKMDFSLFWAMVYYIDAFPDRLHHPKEDDWLFSRLKQRTQLANSLIDTLQRQHLDEPAALAAIRRDLGNFEAGVPGSLAVLQATIATYADFIWKHLRAEENELLPLAEAHLLASDWDDIAHAFAQNADPLVGSADSEIFDALFHDIVKRTPAPLGLGAA